MKTMWQSHGKMLTCIVFLLVFLSLHPRATSAQSPADTPICTYQETRQNVPINPKTNKPYTPEQRNHEPFGGASISKEDIKHCLRAEKSIMNHHIVFEDYRAAWQELAQGTGKYDTDYSDASFQRAFMLISGFPPMKALYTQGVRTPISSKASTSANMAIGPYYSSTCANAASVWGSQKVMSMARYRSMAVVRAARACSPRSVW